MGIVVMKATMHFEQCWKSLKSSSGYLTVVVMYAVFIEVFLKIWGGEVSTMSSESPPPANTLAIRSFEHWFQLSKHANVTGAS